jgi:ATP-binding cassette subfamily C protein
VTTIPGGPRPASRPRPRARSFLADVWSIGRWRLVWAGGLAIAVGVTSGASALLLVPLVRAAGLDPGSGGRFIVRAFDAGLALAGVRPTLGVAIAALVVVTAAQSGLARLERATGNALELDVIHTWRMRVFERLCATEWVAYSRHRASDILETLVEQVGRVGAAARLIVQLGSSAAVAVAYALVAVRLSVPVTLAALVAGGALVLALAGRRRRSTALGRRQSEAYKALYASLAESLTTMKTIRAYNGEAAHIAMVNAASRRLHRHYRELIDVEDTSKQVFEVGSVIVLGAIAYVALAWLHLPPAELFVLLFVFARVTPRLSGLHAQYQRLRSELPAFDLVWDLYTDAAVPAETARAPRGPVSFTQEVRLDHVAFSYTAAPVLRDVTLRIGGGQTIAIVGPSGSGKTTVADVLLGLLAPQSGQLLVDGASVGSERGAAWREQLGYVPQDSVLFHDTIRANLLWAAPTATASDLQAALEAASAWRFVSAAPQGLDSVVGDRGMLLSGGERQRLALARALLRRPRLLILDEATSALDSENEGLIERAIDGLHGRMAIVLIAHRLSTVRRADMIYVLQDGVVAEAGSWDYLVKRPSRFRALCEAQGIDLGRSPVERPELVRGA